MQNHNQLVWKYAYILLEYTVITSFIRQEGNLNDHETSLIITTKAKDKNHN
jgi:hypothetical protein